MAVIRQMHEDSATLAEIGKRLGLFGVWVRQLLPRARIQPRTGNETRRIRRAQQLKRADEIVTAYKECGDRMKIHYD